MWIIKKINEKNMKQEGVLILQSVKTGLRLYQLSETKLLNKNSLDIIKLIKKTKNNNNNNSIEVLKIRTKDSEYLATKICL